MSDTQKPVSTAAVKEKKPYTQTKSLEQVKQEIQQKHRENAGRVNSIYRSNKSQYNDNQA